MISETKQLSSPDTKLVKVGDLAKRMNLLPSTIRYYVRMGLLEPDGRTQGGYALFDPDRAISRLQRIRKLKSQGFKLDEIASILVGEEGASTA